jgi:hypothetical protein
VITYPIYDSIEPFGGYKLKEDTNIGWDEVKRNLLAARREPGNYLYHKSKGTPSYVLFQVIDDSDNSMYEWEPPQVDNVPLSIYRYADRMDRVLFDLWVLSKYFPKTYEDFKKEALERNGSEQSIVRILSANTDNSKYFKTKYISGKYEKDNPYISVADHVKKLLPKYQIFPNIEKSNAVSKDVGIINPTVNESGTILAFLDIPKESELREIGYRPAASKISPMSREGKNDFDKYQDTNVTGKFQHDARDDLIDALEASKGVEVGWAGDPNKSN